jgi:hypothetical protein
MKENLKYQNVQGMKGLMLSYGGQRVHLASTYELTYFTEYMFKTYFHIIFAKKVILRQVHNYWKKGVEETI